MTTAPAAANRGASSREVVAAGREQRDVEAGRVGGRRVLDHDLAAAPRQRRAGRAGRGEEADLRDREVALGEQPAHDAADLAGRADDADAQPALIGRSRRRRRPRLVAAELERRRAAAATAHVDVGARDDDRDADLRGRDHLDVDARRRPAPRRTSRRRRGATSHAGADERHLADLVVVQQRLEADLALQPRQRRHRRLAVGLGQRERDVGAAGGAADTFCTIMSMLTPASASAAKIAAASPGLSGTPTTVIFASLRSCATPVMIACSTLRPPRDRSVTTRCPRRARTTSGRAAARRSGGRTRRSAGAAPWRRRRPSRASPRRRRGRACGRVGTMRGSAVKTPSTSV